MASRISSQADALRRPLTNVIIVTAPVAGNAGGGRQSPAELSEDIPMDPAELPGTVAYCGLVCGLCPPPRTCECRTKPKPAEANCYQRNCCLRKGLDGCWECDEFPCDNGYFSKGNMWRGLNVASVQCVRDGGKEGLVRLLLARHGQEHYHGFYTHKTPEEVLRMLQNPPASPDS